MILTLNSSSLTFFLQINKTLTPPRQISPCPSCKSIPIILKTDLFVRAAYQYPPLSMFYQKLAVEGRFPHH